jgi:hypothetical protein
VGVSNSPAELRRKLERLADDYQDLPLALVKESSLIVKTSVLAFTSPASGGDLKLSGVGKKGAKVGVRYNVAGVGSDAKSLVFVTGPFHLLERDTKSGVRVSKRRRGRGKNRFVGPMLGYHHPGTQGKHPFAKGVAAATPAVEKLFQVRSALAIRRIF